MKICWHSNAPWANSGYGQQTALNLPLIRDLGHEIAVSAFFGLHGAKLTWDGFDVYPGDADVWGNDVLTAHALHWFGGDLAAGVIVTLLDVWTLVAPSLRHFVVGSWCPVDHDPLPPAVLEYFGRSAAVPIAMSRFGESKLREAGLEPLYVPHAVDQTIFHPVDGARAAFGWPDDWYVFGMVAANKGNTPSRKSFPQVFEAFARMCAKHDDVRLYVHAEQLGVYSGLDLLRLAAACGVPDDRIMYADQYALRIGIPQDIMPWYYSAIDCLVNPSYGEGFGIPILEAQACGKPVIVSDCTSMPELLGAGWLVRTEPWWHAQQGSFYGYPSPKAIYGAMDTAYRSRKDHALDALALAGRYEAGLVAREYWEPALEVLASRLPSSAKPISLKDLGDMPAVPSPGV